MTIVNDLISTFEANSNAEYAAGMKTYLKNKFEHFGIKAPIRRALMKSVSEKHRLQIRDTIRTLVFDLYDHSQRELHYCAMELFEKQLRRSYVKEDILLIEKLITTNAWWDTVDFIAKQILGTYLLMYPDETQNVISEFSDSDHMWLNRSAIIYQLAYKDKTDEKRLFDECTKHRESNEFFIQKAIGWALREYGKTNPEAVLKFANSAQLKPLSYREAIRNIVK